MTLKSLALDELSQVTVTISPPSGYPGSVWNVGEYAFVTINVKNTSGDILRDVMSNYLVWGGGVSIKPLTLFGNLLFDGKEHWDELEPGDSVSYVVRLKANYAGTYHTCVSLSGEVVPYATKGHAAVRDITIIGA